MSAHIYLTPAVSLTAPGMWKEGFLYGRRVPCTERGLLSQREADFGSYHCALLPLQTWEAT